MKGIEKMISDELSIDQGNGDRQTRSDTRRAVEDLLEVRRYKQMLDDYYDVE